MTPAEHLFRKELAELLARYDAELTIEDDYGQPARLNLYIQGQFDYHGETVRPRVDTYLETPFDGKSS